MFRKTFGKLAQSCCLAAAVFAVPATALADRKDHDRGDRYRSDQWRHDRHDDHRSSPSIGITIGTRGGPAAINREPRRVVEERVWVEPVFRTVTDHKWTPPVYRTVTERVWIEPVTRTIPDRKWVPDRYEWQEVVHYDRHGRRCVRRERVLVERAHFVDCPRTIEIATGRWETCTRQELVCEGRWETCERQELVSAGYWTTRQVIVEPAPAPPPVRYGSSHARIDLRFPVGR